MRALIAAFTLLAVTGCGGPETATTSSATEAPAKVFAVGEAATADGVEVTITAIQQTNRIADAPGIPATGADEIYVVAHYTLKNTGTEPMNILARPNVELQDASGQTFARDEFASSLAAAMKDMASNDIDINPGTTGKYAAVWKIAKKGFDLKTWKIVVQSDPALEFKLK
jgi:hypothetical protein